MNEKNDVIQILGCLMKRPTLLSQTDKYTLSIADFSTNFERYIFDAIEGLYHNGANKISVLDVENALEVNASALRIFESNKGHEYLMDAEEFSEEQNFDYYYNHLKKINALKSLKKIGVDISDFYCDDLTDNRAIEINQNFEKLSVNEIFEAVKKKILKVEQNFTQDELTETSNVFEGIDELLDESYTGADVGLPLQGEITTLVMGGARLGTLMLRSMASGCGKALPNSTIIPTPNGYKTVGDVKNGDYLFDALGKPTQVLGVYPQGKHDVWEVTFKSGRKALCNEEHLWSFCRIKQPNSIKKERKFVTKTLKEIIQTESLKRGKEYEILVPQNYSVQYATAQHYIPPYIMGLILGDGSFRYSANQKGFTFSSADTELPETIAMEMGWTYKKDKGKNYSYTFEHPEDKWIKGINGIVKKNVWVEEILKDYPELWQAKSEDKFIPQEYLFDGIENRFNLLSGLLDTDGSVDKKGRISYYTVSPKLRDCVIELARGLGFKVTYRVDEHKKNNACYVVHISGRPEDKNKLFRLPRKRAIMEEWYNNSKRKESNEFDAIVSIKKIDYQEEMTCFYVDNQEHLFLMNDYIVTHNTRNMVGDACLLAFPYRYNPTTLSWEQKGCNEKVLFIATEQSKKEIQRMVLAYLTGINESKFRYGTFTDAEKKVIAQAKTILEKYQDNLVITQMPAPTNELLRNTIHEQCILNNISYVFFDYIFISPALLKEFKGFNLRNDELLLILSTTLKNLATELNVFIMSGTQVNASADDNKNIRNEASLAGGRATVNKADYAMIGARPTVEELGILEPLTRKIGIEPNRVFDVYKVRSGEWTQVRIWSYFDLGILRKQDLFVTDSRLNFVDLGEAAKIDFEDWENEQYIPFLNELNEWKEA